jgi:hypothetical protein
MKLGALIVARCKRDPKFKAQVLKSLYRQLVNTKTAAECKAKVLKAVQAIEKLR